MSEYALAGPDIGVRLLDLDGLMECLGPDAGIRAARGAENAAVILASSDPLRLVRLHRQAETGLSFSDYLAMVPPDAVPPEPASRQPANPAAEPEDDDDDDEDEDTGELPSVRQVLDGPLESHKTVQDLVRLHETGKSMFFHFDCEVKITVPYRMTVVASSEEEAHEVFQAVQTKEELPQGDVAISRFDASVVLSKAITAFNHADAMQDAGWVLDCERAKKFSTEEVVALAKQMIADQLRALEEETVQTARIIRAAMRNRS